MLTPRLRKSIAEAAADSGSETGATTPQCSAYPWGEMMLPAPAPAPAVADPHLWPLWSHKRTCSQAKNWKSPLGMGLRAAPSSYEDGPPDFGPFLCFFSTCKNTCYQEEEQRVGRRRKKKLNNEMWTIFGQSPELKLLLPARSGPSAVYEL